MQVKVNADYSIETRMIADNPVIVIDNFLEDHALLRAQAAEQSDEFKPTGNAYPGKRAAMEGFEPAFQDVFREHVQSTYGLIDRFFQFQSSYSLTMSPEDQLAPAQTRPHRDMVPKDPRIMGLAGIVFLFENTKLGGTAFYNKTSDESFKDMPAGQGYQVASDEYFELEGVCHARPNRCIIFDCSRFHSGHIEHPELLCSDLGTGRLTLNFFLKSFKA